MPTTKSVFDCICLTLRRYEKFLLAVYDYESEESHVCLHQSADEDLGAGATVLRLYGMDDEQLRLLEAKRPPAFITLPGRVDLAEYLRDTAPTWKLGVAVLKDGRWHANVVVPAAGAHQSAAHHLNDLVRDMYNEWSNQNHSFRIGELKE